MDQQMELLQAPLHGYGVLLPIQQIFDRPARDSARRALSGAGRLEHQGWITGSRGGSESKRQAKYYRLTAGQRKLQTEAQKWNRMADVIAGIRQERRRNYEFRDSYSVVVAGGDAPVADRARDGCGAALPH